MNIYEQKQNMEEAFEVYLKECCDINNDVYIYKDIIEECLRKREESGNLSSFNTIDELKNFIIELIADPQYEEQTKPIIDNEEEISEDIEYDAISYIEALEKYRDFLTSYKFFKEWSKPTYIEGLEDDLGRNTVFFGAPGTGKSFEINQRIKKTKDEAIRITFHPDTDYSAFVGCYKPIKEDGELTYEFVPQAFINAYIKAWQQPDKPVYLVIEEINRGNCAQIFGDIFQLLDRFEEDSEEGTKGYSKYPINADSDLCNYLKGNLSNCDFSGIKNEADRKSVESGEKLCLPGNLWIFATMNTSDQSLYPMDSAFKRRWEWKYVPISFGRQEKYIVTDIRNNGKGFEWSKFLDKVNKCIIEITKSEDKQLGYWFVGDTNRISVSTFVNKVVFYLWNDIFKDYQDEGNSPFKKCGGLTFQSFYNKGIIDVDKIKEFLLKGLELEIKEDVFRRIEIEKQIVDNQRSGSNSGKLRVTFSDGRTFADNNATKVLEDVIEEIGIERVRNLNIMVSGSPLVAANIEEIKNKSNYRQTAFKHKLSNGMFLFTTSSTPTKADQLKRIATQLDIDYKVEITNQTSGQDEDTD